MPAFSVVIIALNEADRLAPLLQVLEFADERLVIDGGSQDGTPALCEALGARVVHRRFDDFVSQRNFGLQQAQHNWVLFLDADERPDERLQDALRHFQSQPPEKPTPQARAYTLRRLNHCLGQPLFHGGWSRPKLLRLVPRAHAHWVGGRVHERLEVVGGSAEQEGIVCLPGTLLHHPYRNQAEHEARIHRYAELAAQDRLQAGGSSTFLHLVLLPLWHFVRRYGLEAGFLDGRAGLIMARMGARYVFKKYARVLEARSKPMEPPCASP